MDWRIQIAVYNLMAECRTNDYPLSVIIQKIRELADRLEAENHDQQ